MLDPTVRKIIHLADKYARNKGHTCLFPGCPRKAINSHGIPRAAIVEALADKGVVLTHNYSFSTLMRIETQSDPIEVIEVGVSKAGVFKGYCSQHDHHLFAPIESSDPEKKAGIVHSLHLRSLSLEFSRKRFVADFWIRFRELAEAHDMTDGFADFVSGLTAARDHFKGILDYFYFHERAGIQDGTNYFILTINRNVRLSACGVFSQLIEGNAAVIGYNLISYADMSLLTLTTFDSTKNYLDDFLKDYWGPGRSLEDIVTLLNEIAFSKGEEPLISPHLWQSLTPDQQLHLRESLRPPASRMTATLPRLIKLEKSDHVSEATPAMWARLHNSLFRDLVAVRVRK